MNGDTWIGKVIVARAATLFGLLVSLATLIRTDVLWLSGLALLGVAVNAATVTWWWSIPLPTVTQSNT